MQATQQEIDNAYAELNNAYAELNKAEHNLVHAKLRIRALKGEALMQSGDSFSSAIVGEVMDLLVKEFGNRNLRVL